VRALARPHSVAWERKKKFKDSGPPMAILAAKNCIVEDLSLVIFCSTPSTA
jgi:hypothetical protein